MRGSHTKWSNSRATGKYCVSDTTVTPNRDIYQGNSIKEARQIAAAFATARIVVRAGSGWSGVEEWANGERVIE